jgi:hypothetical protein
VACLPGIVEAAFCMPDAHWGYGFPIGGVAAMDPETGGAHDGRVDDDAPDDSYHATWFPRILDAFAEAMEDPKAAAANLREARLGQTVIDAAYRSGAKGGAPVDV